MWGFFLWLIEKFSHAFLYRYFFIRLQIENYVRTLGWFFFLTFCALKRWVKFVAPSFVFSAYFGGKIHICITSGPCSIT